MRRYFLGGGARAKVLCVILSASLLGVAAYAQSGRRTPRGSASPQSAEENSAAPSPTPSPAPTGPKRDLTGLTLLVAVEVKGGVSGPARVIFDNFVVHLADAGVETADRVIDWFTLFKNQPQP